MTKIALFTELLILLELSLKEVVDLATLSKSSDKTDEAALRRWLTLVPKGFSRKSFNSTGEANGVICLLHRDAKCGKIQCQGGANRPVIGTNAVSIETNIPLQEGGRILCRGTHVYLGDDMPDPGLVLTGTKCGDSMVSMFETHKTTERILGNQLGSNPPPPRQFSC